MEGGLNRAFAKRDKKQTMNDLRGISTNWFKNQFCPHSIRLSYVANEILTILNTVLRVQLSSTVLVSLLVSRKV